jgi:hypothetical protein
MPEGGAVGVLVLLVGGIFDVVVVDRWFQSLEARTAFSSWNPMIAFLFLHAIPFAASVAAVGIVIGALLRR